MLPIPFMAAPRELGLSYDSNKASEATRMDINNRLVTEFELIM